MTRVLLTALVALALASAACGKYGAPIRESEKAPKGQKPAAAAPAANDPNAAQPGAANP